MIDRNIFKIMLISVIMLFCGFVLIFFNQYHNAGEIKVSDFSYVPWLLAEIFLAFLIEFILLKIKRNVNLWLFPCAFFLANFGLLSVGRIEYALIIPQIRWIILGMVVFFVTFHFEILIKKILNYKYICGILYVSLLSVAIFFGSDVNGISNCITIGSIRFQPLEFAKIIFVFFLASYLGNYKNISEINDYNNSIIHQYDKQIFSLIAFMLAVIFLLFFKANDFGNALIFLIITLIIMYIKTANKFFIILSVILFFTILFLCYYMLPEAKTFFDAWINPWTLSSESSKKIVQSFFALGAGGVWGAGFTVGHPDFILDAYNYFIFSVIAEEFGLIGSVSLIIINVLLFYQSVCVALKLKNNAEILLAFGIGALFFLQVMVTLFSVTNVLPVTKTFLPFIGYGGSATISDFIMLGIIVSLSRKENFND